jgi:hypothetical protein
MARHKVTDAGRRPAGNYFNIVRQTIITIGGMEPGHGRQVLEEWLDKL